MYIICNLLKKNIAGVQSEPAVPASGVRVWLGFEIPHPYPYPGKNLDQTRRVGSTRDNHYARDAAYSPPVNRNVAAKPNQNFKRPEPVYKTLPPIHDSTIAANVYKRSMDAPITLTQRELLSLSPEVRSQVREATTTRRLPNKEGNTMQNYLDTEEEDDYGSQQIPRTIPDTVPTFAVENAHHRTPPYVSIIVADPIETYYKSLRPGELPDPDRLVVAIESGAVRSIFALIDNSQKKECILDPGCQIVAMSEATCHELRLAYDPSIILNMQSANGNIDQSL